MSVTAETRRAAYQDIRVKRTRRQEEILRTITGYGPMTAEELMDALGYRDPNQVRPRLTELAKAGVLRPEGKRISRRSGKMTAVWALVPHQE